MKKSAFGTLVLCLALTLFAASVPLRSETGRADTGAPLEAPYVLLDSWGNEIGVFNDPQAIAIGGDRVYVADTRNHRIQVFDLHGTPLATFGELGSGEGQFSRPEGIAIDGEGNVYVADTYNHRVQKLDSGGSYLTQWGSEGNGDGQFVNPAGIAADGSGNVYVVDKGNHRVQKFTSGGNFLAHWGSEGSGAGQFRSPWGIAVDEEGNVYVTDIWNYRVQKFTSSGTYLTQWGSQGSGEGEFFWPQSIVVDRDGSVFVADAENTRIQKFTSGGTYLTQWGGSGSADGQFFEPTGVTVDESGKVYVVEGLTGGVLTTHVPNNRVQKFDSNGVYLTQWGSGSSSDGQFVDHRGVAVGPGGHVYVADSGNDRVQKLDAYGSFLTRWQGHCLNDEFCFPSGVATDGSGNVYISDTGYMDVPIAPGPKPHIEKFTSDGAYLTQWGEGGSGDGQFSGPESIAMDGEGNLYVADKWNDRVQKFDSNGVYLTQWGSEGGGDGQFSALRGIAADAAGNVYVADTGNHRVQKFTSQGSYLTQWGSEGGGDGQFAFPSGIAVDGDANVYVADTGNHRVQKFASGGTYLTQWGSEGSGEGAFNWPMDVAVDTQSGNVYVADTGNHRIQKFAPGYPAPDALHGLALNGSFEETPELTRWTYGGELPVGLVSDGVHGATAAQLGEPMSQTPQERGKAWLRQTMYITPTMERPMLSFTYRLFANDTVDFSDLHVWLARPDGAALAEITRDGFRSCDGFRPPAGYDLGWRTASYDLSPFKGQSVRLMFENRNLHGGLSLGIWSYVDDVRVVDAGPLPDLPGPFRNYLPLGFPGCDAVVGLSNQAE